MKECIRGHIFVNKEFVPGEVQYENGLITAVKQYENDQLNQLNQEECERYIIPGLVDIHFHGCMGVDFCDLGTNERTVDNDAVDNEATYDIIERIVNYENSVGVTSICPATMTYDEDTLIRVMRATASYIEASKIKASSSDNQSLNTNIVGIYLEGPFISYEKRGAQNPDYIMKPDVDMVKRLNEASGGLIRVVTVAPEVERAVEFIKKVTADDFSRANNSSANVSQSINSGRTGIVCSIAHTTADYDKAAEALNAGADHVTHLYNAMPPFLNRAPGVVGAAFDAKSTYVELIADGIHVHPSAVRATFEMFGADRVVLISDSMEATGKPDGEYALGGQKVIKKGSRAVLTDGTIAGSVTNLFDCMKMAIKMGIPKEDAIAAATLNPAKSIGCEDFIGSIEVGKRAKMVVCDCDLNILNIVN